MSDFLLATPIPPDGRLQVWTHVEVVVLIFELQTRWKATSDPNSQWTAPWAVFDPQPPASVLPFRDMTTGVLSDGRTQIWGIGHDQKVYTTWKVSTAHDSLWNSWSEFSTTALLPSNPIGISVAALPDKRLQLFIMDNSFPNLQIWTAWKTTTDSNSPWTNLAKF
jgi:hypothetical protein